jgi:triphosphatase
MGKNRLARCPASAPLKNGRLGYRSASKIAREESAVKLAPLEVELKLDVSAEDIDKLKRHSLARRWRSSGKRELISVYLDTVDHAFRRRGLSFRLRRKGERLLQTIKGAYRGILDRTEQETPFDCDRDDRHGSIETFLQQFEDRKLPTALKPIFKTRIERETYQIGGIEVCLDKGKVIAGRLSAPIAEIELELKDGDRSALFALARQISTIVPAELSVTSKSERGYDLVGRAKRQAVMAQHAILPLFATVPEAFQFICSECLYHLIANKSGMRALAPEALHQTRVALRRFDTALKLFRQIASGPEAKRVARELRWLGDELYQRP